MPRSTGFASRRCCTTSARWRSRRRSSTSRRELTSADWRSVVQHPRIGQVILEQAGAVKDAVPIILHHHERFAGHGYPFGLRAAEIPLGARIVAIADAYDAMINDRPYTPRDVACGGRRRAASPRRNAVRPGPGEPVLRPLRVRTPRAGSCRRQDDPATRRWRAPNDKWRLSGGSPPSFATGRGGLVRDAGPG